jgi:hypothetical protein
MDIGKPVRKIRVEPEPRREPAKTEPAPKREPAPAPERKREPAKTGQ